MARHLIIGDGTAFGVTNGLVDDGAVSVQKLSASGPTELVIGETFVDAPQIRIVAGGPDGLNVATPWFYGRDVIDYSGKAFSDATAQTSTILPVLANGTASKEIEVKFVRSSGPRTSESFKFSVTIAGSANVATSGTAIHDAFEALSNTPDWLNPLAGDNGAGLVTFTGAKRGDVAQSGNTWDYEPVVFKVLVSLNPETTQTYTVTNHVIDANPGYGDGFAVREYEKNQQGTSHGFYFRGHLPQQPTFMSATGTDYDMYNIIATKDGSSSSQIHGVDNLIEISIALKEGDADSAVVEAKLNGYFGGVFPALSL